MTRCVRLWTGEDQNSHFEKEVIDLEPGARGNMLSGQFPITAVSILIRPGDILFAEDTVGSGHSASLASAEVGDRRTDRIRGDAYRPSSDVGSSSRVCGQHQCAETDSHCRLERSNG